MQIISHKKGFPVVGTFALLMALAFFARGVFTLRGGDTLMPYLQIMLGIFMFVSWTSIILNEVVQVSVDDNEIRYRRRKHKDLVISLSDLIDYEFFTSYIRFRYKAEHDVQSVSIPFRRFNHDDIARLKDIFDRKEAQPQR